MIVDFLFTEGEPNIVTDVGTFDTIPTCIVLELTVVVVTHESVDVIVQDTTSLFFKLEGVKNINVELDPTFTPFTFH